jgi:hypothetical protein
MAVQTINLTHPICSLVLLTSRDLAPGCPRACAGRGGRHERTRGSESDFHSFGGRSGDEHDNYASIISLGHAAICS